MQSIKSKIFIWLMRNKHLIRLKLKPEIVDENFSVVNFRRRIDRMSARMKLPAEVSTKKIKINHIEGEWIIPKTRLKNSILLYIHGGGFISGSYLTHRTHVANFAKKSQLQSLVFNYRLAPENPFPAALEDCIEVYNWLLKLGYKAKSIVVGGESAGGTLTLSLLLALKEKGIDLPNSAFSISPVTDLRCIAKSFEYNESKDIIPIGSSSLWSKYYIGNNDPTYHLLSPQFGNYKGLPPIYICVGTDEIHLDDCENVARIAIEKGVDVTLRKWDKMVHAFPVLVPFLPEAKKAMTEISEFINNNLRNTNNESRIDESTNAEQ